MKGKKNVDAFVQWHNSLLLKDEKEMENKCDSFLDHILFYVVYYENNSDLPAKLSSFPTFQG